MVPIQDIFTILALVGVEFFLSIENSAFNARNLQYVNKAGKLFFLSFGSLFSFIVVRIGGPILLFSLLMQTNPAVITRYFIEHDSRYVHFLEEHQLYIDLFNGGFLFLLAVENIDQIVTKLKKKLGRYIYLSAVLLVTFFFFCSTKPMIALLLASLVGGAVFSVSFLSNWILEANKRQLARRSQGGKSGSLATQMICIAVVEYTDILLSFDSSLTAYSISNRFEMILIGIGTGLVISRFTTVLLALRKGNKKSKLNQHIDRVMVLSLMTTGLVLMLKDLASLNEYLISLATPIAIILYVFYIMYTNHIAKSKTTLEQ